MRKNFARIFIILFTLFLILFLSGLEKRYFYENSKNKTENISIKNCKEFNLQLTANPENKKITGFHIDLTFSKLKQNIIIENANLKIINIPKNEINLTEVSATDGFYNWEPEKNGKAKTFEKLPKNLKVIGKDIKAYFLYSWNFRTYEKEKKDLEINVSLNLLVEGQRVKIEKNIKMKLANEIIFRSPIRFH